VEGRKSRVGTLEARIRLRTPLNPQAKQYQVTKEKVLIIDKHFITSAASEPTTPTPKAQPDPQPPVTSPTRPKPTQQTPVASPTPTPTRPKSPVEPQPASIAASPPESGVPVLTPSVVEHPIAERPSNVKSEESPVDQQPKVRHICL